jgi:hypothetical protein
LGYKLQCSLCLRATAFPIVDPGKSENARWAYRVVGPFALPDYARGGYASALALRCFAEIIGGHRQGQTTWCAGRELALGDDRTVEADFILWYQRKGFMTDGQDSPTDIVFGEAKSFGRDAFKPEDVENLKAIAQRFPCTLLVFATMKEPGELSRAELGAIRKLALWGREYVNAERRTRAPVVVLTGIELFAGFSLQDTWKEVGGRHAQFCEAGQLQANNLRVLADVTQQLYLGLPSYSAWQQAKWDATHARRKARANATQTAAGAGSPAS